MSCLAFVERNADGIVTEDSFEDETELFAAGRNGAGVTIGWGFCTVEVGTGLSLTGRNNVVVVVIGGTTLDCGFLIALEFSTRRPRVNGLSFVGKFDDDF